MSFLLHQALSATRQRLPSKLAVSDGSSQLSYSNFERSVAGLAEQLAKLSLKRGSRVAFYLPHSIDQAICIFAISAIDGVFVPINENLKPDQVRHILSDSGTSVLITSPTLAPTIERALPAKTKILQTSLSELLQGEKLFIEDVATSRNIENDLAGLLYTSGSTGQPKGVMVSHKNLLTGSDIVSEYLQLSENDRLLGILPLSFDYGLNQLISMIHLGGSYFFHTFKFPQEIVDGLERHKITGLAGIPTLWALLVRSSLANTELPHLRFLTNSGGAVPTTIISKLRNAVPNTNIVLMYGLTEAFRSSYLPPLELDRRPTSMGKAIPNTELFVLDEDGKTCSPGQVGELVHRGPTVALGYWKRAEATAERFRHFPCSHGASPIGEMAVYSGDLVKTDDEGFLYFVGRKDGLIKRSGFRISPSEIEEVVSKLSFVKSCAAIGVDHPQEGQTIKVYFVNSQTEIAPSLLKKQLLEHCTKDLPRHMVPSFFENIDSLPKTANGKVDYPALKKLNVPST